MAVQMAQLMVPRWAEHSAVDSARPKAEHLVRPMAEHWAVTMALSMAVPKVELTGQRRVVNSVCSRAERKVLLMVACLAAWTAP